MNGHEKVIHMRQAGSKPKIVFVNDYPCQTDWFEHGDHATVCVAGDQPEWLDLRFLVGLTVSVSASTENRAKRFLEACKGAGAAVVAVGSPPAQDDPWCERNYSEVWRRG